MIDPGLIDLLLIYCLVAILGGFVLWIIGGLMVALAGEERGRRR